MADEPKFSICQFTTNRLTFQEDLDVYVKSGVAGIGICESKLPTDRDDEMVERFEASGLTATVCIPQAAMVLPSKLGGPRDPQERIQMLCDGIRRLARFNPARIVLVTGPAGTMQIDEARRIAINGLRLAAQTAAEYHIPVGLEPLHAEVLGDCTMISTIPETLEMIDQIGHLNVGILFDVYHLWDTPDILEKIVEHAHLFGDGIHINDWRQPPRSWADRVLPGEGTMDLPALLNALEAGGFDGWYDLEIFSDDGTHGNAYPDSLWKLDPLDVVRRGKAGFMRAWQARRAPA